MVAAVNELRIWVAMRLATDIDTCCALLRGEPVDPSGLDPDELNWAHEMRFVRLDVSAISLFEPQLRKAA
jgi:hypothetical protein